VHARDLSPAGIEALAHQLTGVPVEQGNTR
jgi:hypothetical protein